MRARRPIAVAAVIGLGACASAAACGAREKAREAASAPERSRQDVADHAPTPWWSAPPGGRLGEGVAPLGYRLTLELDPEQSNFRGEVTLDVAIAAPTAHVWLNARGLTLERVAAADDAGDVAASVANVPARELWRVDLAREVSGHARLTFAYRGHVDTGYPYRGLFREPSRGHSYVYSQLEAMYARRVLPCFDEPRWKVPWEVTLVVPPAMVAASNAPEVARTTRDDGRLEVRFAPTPPMASHLLAVAVGPFEIVDVGPVGRAAIPARILVPAGRSAQAMPAAAAMPGVVAVLERFLDRPLPLAKLDSVVVPEFFGAMENPGLVTYAESLLLAAAASPGELPRGFLSTAAHELAHQWFGNAVTMAWWDDLWISEAFASWLAAEVMPALDPVEARAQRWPRAQAIARDLGRQAAPIRRAVTSVEDAEDAFARGVYDKGSAVLAMLAHAVGEERFVEGLRRLLDAHGGGTVTLDDVGAAMGTDGADVAASLRSFFDVPGVPRVELRLDCSGAPAAVASITRATTLGAALARPAAPLAPSTAATPLAPAIPAGSMDAHWHVPLCVRFPDIARGGAAGERCGWLDGAGGRVELGLPSCPRWLSGNVDGSGYYLTAYEPALARTLLDRVLELPVADRSALAADLIAELSAGRTTVAEALAWAERLLAAPEPRDTVAALALVRAIDDQLAALLRPRWQAWLRARVVPAAQAQGVLPRAGESAAAAAARRALAEAAGLLAGDPVVLGRASLAARAWLDHGGPLDEDALLALRLAAAGDDLALFDRLLARVRDEREPFTRAILRSAIATVRAPRLIDRLFEQLAPSTLGQQDSLSLLAALLANPATQDRAWQLVAPAGPRLALGASWMIIPAAGHLCTTAQRAELERLYADDVRYDQQVARSLPVALDAIDDCVARRAHQAASAAATLPPLP